jgi:hypothetical protein
MKSLYESILSSTKSGKKGLFKSFDIDDIWSSSDSVEWDKFIDMNELKKIVKRKLKISTNRLGDGRLFALYLTTIDFTNQEWDIIQNSPSSKIYEVDKIFKEKFDDVLIKELVNDYKFGKRPESLYIKPNIKIKSSKIVGGIDKFEPWLIQFKLSELSF